MCKSCGCGCSKPGCKGACKKGAKKSAKKTSAKKMTGKQSKLDMDKNGKLDGKDFAMLRGKKKK
jgi:hypothetical protein